MKQPLRVGIGGPVGSGKTALTLALCRALRERYEIHHGVRIKDSALVAAAILSNRYISDRFLPDKAIDVIDEAGAKARLKGQTPGKVLDAAEIEEIIAQIARIPARSV